MVFPNFFITFVRHSFHTSHPCTSPSRERRHRPAPPYHQAPHFPHGTRAASRAMHTRCTSQKAMLTRHAHATHPRLSQHTRPPHYNPRKGLCHTRCSPSQHTRPPHYPRKGLCHAHPTRKNAAMLSLTAPSFQRRKSEPPQPKYYILQYYM